MSEAPARSFAASVATLAGVRLLGLIAAFITNVVAARALGQAGFGAAGVAVTVGLFAALACNGGVNIAVIYLGGTLRERRGAVLGAASTIAGGGMVLSAVMVAVVAVTIGAAIGLDGRGDLFIAAALVGIGVIGHEYGGAILLTLGRDRAFAVTELVRSFVTLLAVIALLWTWTGDTAYVVAAAAGYVAGAALAFGVARIAGGSLRPRWHRDLIGRGLAIGLRGQAGNVLQFLNLRLDLLLVPALLNLSAAGLYLVAVRMSEVLTQVATAAGSLLFPAVATEPDPSATQLTERTARLSMLIVAFAALVMGLASGPLLTAAFGAEYAGAVDTLRILAIAMLPLSLTRILAGDLKGRGRPGSVSIAMLVALAATVALDIALIPRMGIAGAALASLGAYFLSAAALAATFHRLTGASPLALLPGPADLAMLVQLLRRRRFAAG